MCHGEQQLKVALGRAHIDENRCLPLVELEEALILVLPEKPIKIACIER